MMTALSFVTAFVGGFLTVGGQYRLLGAALIAAAFALSYLDNLSTGGS